ncbi:MAG TPA: cytochrome D1 domain-containing protein [Methylibium sp.]|uniref:cytochrome D1 domain-containing protein n=1 Tax=Methylibium sp. TaxID=2067992 RepID=UPI002DBBB459|nr:cytochrome D1 domain-containing protein [Methylibium sp.]HEU4458465.1 cytochrome D1 domain-containing protein [Methylibium sp.]
MNMTLCSPSPSLRRLGLLLAVAAAPAVAPAADAGRAFVTNEKGGVAVVDLATMQLKRDFATGLEGARGISLTGDGRWLLTANRGSGDVAVIDAKTGEVTRRIKIGENPEFIRVRGDFAYVSYEPGERPGGPPPMPGASAPAAAPDSGKPEEDDEAEEPAEVAVIDLKRWQVVKRIKSGRETEGIEFSRDGRHMVVTNEGDQTVSMYDRASGKLLRSVKTAKWGTRPRGIARLPDGSGYLVTLEFSAKLVLLDNQLRFKREIATGNSPYGVAFDPSGQRLYVASARSDRVDVFDAKTYAPLMQLPVGKRCWHFSFTPAGDKLLVACGRSDALYTFDLPQHTPAARIEGLAMPWGIVTSPKAVGSIDTY